MDLIDTDFIFWFCALAGSSMFLLQFVLSLFVGGVDEFDDDLQDIGKIKCLSKQAITGFFMMFGWSALTCKKQFELGNGITIGVAAFSGLFMIFIIGFIFKWARKLRSTGTVFRIEDAIGKRAIVYQRIPKGGAGKVSIVMHQLTHEIDAVSQNEEEIPSFMSVQVIKTTDDGKLVVVPTQ